MEQQDRQEQVAEFFGMMKAHTHEWGFIVVCTATTLTDDQLTTSPDSLRALVLANPDSSAEVHPDTLALPLMHLPGADISAARAALIAWISAYDDIGGDWDCDVLRNVSVIADDAAVESLLAVGGGGEPWVVAIDAKYTQNCGTRQDYPGYRRCWVRCLWTLSEGLEALSPPRRYADQISLFDGSRKDRYLSLSSLPGG